MPLDHEILYGLLKIAVTPHLKFVDTSLPPIIQIRLLMRNLTSEYKIRLFSISSDLKHNVSSIKK